MSRDITRSPCTALLTAQIAGVQALTLKVTITIGLDEASFTINCNSRLSRRLLLNQIRKALNPEMIPFNAGCAEFDEPLRGPQKRGGDPLAERSVPKDPLEWDCLDRLMNDLHALEPERKRQEKAYKDEAKRKRKEASEASRIAKEQEKARIRATRLPTQELRRQRRINKLAQEAEARQERLLERISTKKDD